MSMVMIMGMRSKTDLTSQVAQHSQCILSFLKKYFNGSSRSFMCSFLILVGCLHFDLKASYFEWFIVIEIFLAHSLHKNKG